MIKKITVGFCEPRFFHCLWIIYLFVSIYLVYYHFIWDTIINYDLLRFALIYIDYLDTLIYLD